MLQFSASDMGQDCLPISYFRNARDYNKTSQTSKDTLLDKQNANERLYRSEVRIKTYTDTNLSLLALKWKRGFTLFLVFFFNIETAASL